MRPSLRLLTFNIPKFIRDYWRIRILCVYTGCVTKLVTDREKRTQFRSSRLSKRETKARGLRQKGGKVRGYEGCPRNFVKWQWHRHTEFVKRNAVISMLRWTRRLADVISHTNAYLSKTDGVHFKVASKRNVSLKLVSNFRFVFTSSSLLFNLPRSFTQFPSNYILLSFTNIFVVRIKYREIFVLLVCRILYRRTS